MRVDVFARLSKFKNKKLELTKKLCENTYLKRFFLAFYFLASISLDRFLEAVSVLPTLALNLCRNDGRLLRAVLTHHVEEARLVFACGSTRR